MIIYLEFELIEVNVLSKIKLAQSITKLIFETDTKNVYDQNGNFLGRGEVVDLKLNITVIVKKPFKYIGLIQL